VIEEQASVVRQVYCLYTEKGWSIGAIVRWLNAQGIPTRRGKSLWERTTVWAMLRNPAYQGTACFGKTEKADRQKVTRLVRRRGGFSSRSSATKDRPRKEWIPIAVPAIVSAETFALAEERLQQNKIFASRHTKVPTLLQGMLICQVCGYAYYRTSTRTSARKLYYYRCLGSDDWRYPKGHVCTNRPVRQDYLDDLVWREKILVWFAMKWSVGLGSFRIPIPAKSARRLWRKRSLVCKRVRIGCWMHTRRACSLWSSCVDARQNLRKENPR
jgi:site-specific DNA recombinase